MAGGGEGDDGSDGYGTGTGDAFGFDAGGYVGYDALAGGNVSGLSGYEGYSGGGSGGLSGAAAAGYDAGAAAYDGSIGGGSYGSYGGTAAGDAIAAGYGLASGDYGTGTGDAFGFDSAGYVGYDAAGNALGGLSGYEGFGGEAGGLGGSAADAAAAAAAAAAIGGAGWGSYEAGTVAAAIANALAAQGKPTGYITAAVQDVNFATGFAQGAANALAAQAAQAAQMAAQGIFGIVGPNNPMATPAMVDEYNAIIDQVTRDVTAQKTAQFQTVFGINLNTFDPYNNVPFSQTPFEDPNVNPNPVSVADPTAVSNALSIVGDQTYTGFDPSGLYGPAYQAPSSPTTVDPYFDNPFDRGREDEYAPDPEYDPEAPAINPDIKGQVETETLLGMVNDLTAEDWGLKEEQALSPEQIDDLITGMMINAMPSPLSIDDQIQQSIKSAFENKDLTPEQLDALVARSQEFKSNVIADIRATNEPEPTTPPVDPTTLFDDPFANITARSPVDPGRFGINQAAAPDVAQHAMVSALDPSAVFGLSPADQEALVSMNPALYDAMQAPISPDDLQAAISLNPALYDMMQSPLGPELQAAISLNPSMFDLIQGPLGPDLQAAISLNPSLYDVVAQTTSPARAAEIASMKAFETALDRDDTEMGKAMRDAQMALAARTTFTPALPTAEVAPGKTDRESPAISPDFVTAPEERASPGVASVFGPPGVSTSVSTAPDFIGQESTNTLGQFTGIGLPGGFNQNAPDTAAPTAITVGGTQEAPGGLSTLGGSPFSGIGGIGGLGGMTTGEPGSGFIVDPGLLNTWMQQATTPEDQWLQEQAMLQQLQRQFGSPTG